MIYFTNYASDYHEAGISLLIVAILIMYATCIFFLADYYENVFIVIVGVVAPILIGGICLISI